MLNRREMLTWHGSTLELPTKFDGIHLKKAGNQSIPKATGKRKRHSVDLKVKEEADY